MHIIGELVWIVFGDQEGDFRSVAVSFEFHNGLVFEHFNEFYFFFWAQVIKFKFFVRISFNGIFFTWPAPNSKPHHARLLVPLELIFPVCYLLILKGLNDVFDFFIKPIFWYIEAIQ